MERYDVIVVGGGVGGYTTAIRLSQLGKKVILVEKEKIGGTCLNRGCIPTKALLHASKMISSIKKSKEIGIVISDFSIDTTKLDSWKNRVVERLRKGVSSLLKMNGIEVREGEAKIVSPNQVKINGGKLVEADHIVLATGSTPMGLPGIEPNGKTIITSNEALEVSNIPRRMLIIGAGAIGLELASVYSSLGTEITIVEIMEQVLPGTDREIADFLYRSFLKKGLEIYLESRVTKIEGESPVTVTFETKRAEEKREVDVVLLSVGRRPASRGFGLEELGIETDRRGYISVGEDLRTNVGNIFAIGDVIGPPLLAHKAIKEGIAVAEIISGIKERKKFSLIPACIYTSPELAVVGMTEKEAGERGIKYRVGKFSFSASGRALTQQETEGFCKVLIDEKDEALIGIHLVGPSASDMISLGTFAIESKIKARELSHIVFPHPTLTEAIEEAIENAYGRAIHTINR